jgi:hypothetical protein
MTDIVQLRKDAVAEAEKAVAADSAENFEDACKYYIRAAEKLQYIAKIDENTYNKETYRKKATEYCERAKKLKEVIIAREENAKQPVTSDGG